MNVIKLGKKGQVSIPTAVLKRLGLSGEVLLQVDTTPDGSILLRPSSVYPIELYDEQRIKGFLAEDEMPPALAERLRVKLATLRSE